MHFLIIHFICDNACSLNWILKIHVLCSIEVCCTMSSPFDVQLVTHLGGPMWSLWRERVFPLWPPIVFFISPSNLETSYNDPLQDSQLFTVWENSWFDPHKATYHIMTGLWPLPISLTILATRANQWFSHPISNCGCWRWFFQGFKFGVGMH
jgi:hypothetical protein